jgi:hypothetical protein
VETLESIRRRLEPSKLNLREANRRFGEGDISTALGVYLLLNEQRPLQMYADNALHAAKKLGLGKLECIEDLRKLVIPQ